jgi:DNA repair protein RadD
VPTLLPPQRYGVEAASEAERGGCKAILVTSPTGGGKTLMMSCRAKLKADSGLRVGILTHRRTLLAQTGEALSSVGAEHGYVARGFGNQADRRITVLSLGTVFHRMMDGDPEHWRLPPLNDLEVDEAHANATGIAEQVIGHYLRSGATVCGWTASPVGCAHIYKRLIVAGTKAEMRQHGRIVPCHVYAPDEPDMRGIARHANGEFSAHQAARRIMQTTVFGDVFEHYHRVNPHRRAAILWAPGRAESRWFCQQFMRRGVSAAHLDGTTEDAEREDIFGASRDGRLNVICSCDALREGLNQPHLYHGILVRACGAMSTYLQLVGRILRAAPGKDHCILQDHSGAWWRHGSPNADIPWRLGDTNRVLAAARAYRLSRGDEQEPQRCPECGGVRAYAPGKPCPHCGHVYRQSVRSVRMVGGTLVKVVGTVHRRREQGDEDKRQWKKCLYAAACSLVPRTFLQAAADFRRRTGHPLPADMPYLPEPGSIDWARPIPAVYPEFRVRRKKP